MKTTIFFVSLLLQIATAAAAVPATRTSHQKDFRLNSSYGAGQEVYFECSSAESKAEFLLRKMGATNIHVQCYGGIDWMLPPEAWDSSLSVSYDTLRLPTSGEGSVIQADWHQVDIKSNGDCYLMSQVFNQTYESFEIQDQVGPSTCARSDSNFRLSFFTLDEI